ncbi:perlucin-like protein [Mercenaria mercenaria]|uniref:perlucin-like protein n=1 Tax=Mercenaria mercenaria TaxID=6596 RepID=UPI00234F5057|nr:perlucin-like protein [Mercenaria mercenaria]
MAYQGSVIAIAISLLFFQVLVHGTDCPDRWIAYRGSCYLFAHGGPLSFYEAEHYCNQHNGGHLVHINDQVENLFIKDELRSIKADDTWIGLTDEATEGLWEWYDTKTSPTFTDWNPGEPNSNSGNEDCAATKTDLDFRWYDGVCSDKKIPLCEITGETDVIG